MLQGGADIRYVQEMLGHTSAHTTEIYTHLDIRDLKDAAAQARRRKPIKAEKRKASGFIITRKRNEIPPCKRNARTHGGHSEKDARAST